MTVCIHHTKGGKEGTGTHVCPHDQGARAVELGSAAGWPGAVGTIEGCNVLC